MLQDDIQIVNIVSGLPVEEVERRLCMSDVQKYLMRRTSEQHYEKAIRLALAIKLASVDY